MKKQTQQLGANLRTSVILAKIRREMKNSTDGNSVDGGILVEWISRADERANKKAGGLGRQ